MPDIEVKIRPGMNLPLEEGGVIKGGENGKVTTINEDYFPKVSYFCEAIEPDEPAPETEGGEESPGTTRKPRGKKAS